MPMDLHPAIAGSDVSRPISGSVLSIHEHAINIREGNAWRLTSLVDRERDLTALSLLIGTEELRTVARSYKPGDAISLDVAQADSWSGALPAAPLDGKAAASLCEQSGEIAQALAAHGRSGGLRDLVTGAVGPALPEQPWIAGDNGPSVASTTFLARAALVLRGAAEKRGRAARSGLDLSALVGLGVGFTPSGDDFVTGALAADALLSPGCVVDRSGLEGRLTSTTIGGATLLGLALEASFPRYMVHFVCALLEVAGEYGRPGREHSGVGPDDGDNAAGRVARAVAEAAEHGETSGTDAVSGFLYALNSYCSAERLDE